MKSASDLSLLKLIFPTNEAVRALTAFTKGQDGVSHERIEDSLHAINRRFSFTLKTRVLDHYTNNRIVLLGNRDRVKVPSAFPAWRVISDGRMRAYINCVPYLPASETAAIDNRKLYGLMQFGSALLDSAEFEKKLNASIPIARAGSKVYSRMMHRIADRVLGIGIDPMRSDQVRYLFSKYFLIGLLGREANSTTASLALESIRGKTSQVALDAFEAAVAEKAGVKSQDALYRLALMPFLAAFTTSEAWTAKLTSRQFVGTFVSSYGDPSLLAMEELGYFVAVLGCHQASSGIVNEFSFEPVYGKEGDEFLSEFARLTIL